jgi:hypothetical protein
MAYVGPHGRKERLGVRGNPSICSTLKTVYSFMKWISRSLWRTHAVKDSSS